MTEHNHERDQIEGALFDYYDEDPNFQLGSMPLQSMRPNDLDQMLGQRERVVHMHDVEHGVENSKLILIHYGNRDIVLNPMGMDEHLCVDVHSFIDGDRVAGSAFGLTEGHRNGMTPLAGRDTPTSHGHNGANVIAVLLGEQGSRPQPMQSWPDNPRMRMRGELLKTLQPSIKGQKAYDLLDAMLDEMFGAEDGSYYQVRWQILTGIDSSVVRDGWHGVHATDPNEAEQLTRTWVEALPEYDDRIDPSVAIEAIIRNDEKD